METGGKPFAEIPTLTAYLDIYNKAGVNQLVITENNCLTSEFGINERKYLTIKDIEG